jgi:hypothetical protein
MHTEVHVHGVVPLKGGVTQSEVEQALKAWLEYVDLDGLADARSANQDEPGIVYDRRRRVLDICWTGWVGRNFQRALEAAFETLGTYAEDAAGVEVSFYHDDGRDERTMVFVGPSAQSIQEAQRSTMLDDVAQLLSRHFTEGESAEVLQLVHQMFERRWASNDAAGGRSLSRPEVAGSTPSSSGKKHLH